MVGESVFTVSDAVAVAATPISLTDAGLKERQHLQEWVIAHPSVLGPGVKIVAFEFGSWTGAMGEKEKDRLDVLALDSDGHLIVVELKRDKAPDTVDMQALKYAALVSRFTRDDLDRVHARYLTKQTGSPVSAEDAADDLDSWATITEETLRLPRVVLMASEFPPTVTATVVFLHQQLGLDVRLLAFQAYQTANDVLLTVSQHYPPPGIEEFVLSPEVSEAQQAKATKQKKQREISAVARLIDANVLSPGERLEFKAPSASLQAEVSAWLGQDPARRYATWQDDVTAPLVWEADAESYSPTGLARKILKEAAGRTSQVQGPLYWVNDEGDTLVDLAPPRCPRRRRPPRRAPEPNRRRPPPVWKGFRPGSPSDGPGHHPHFPRPVNQVLPHLETLPPADLQGPPERLHPWTGLPAAGHQDDSVVVAVTGRYLHAQVRTPADYEPVLALVRKAYDNQTA